MPLYCSLEVFEALAGAAFPATRRELLDYAKRRDAPEAVVVILNQLPDAAFRDISDVCHNAGIVCSVEAAQALAGAAFPAGSYKISIRASAPEVYPGEMAVVTQEINILPYYQHMVRIVA